MRECLIAIGSNLSQGVTPRRALVLNAVEALARVGRVRARSSLWRAPAWPDPRRPAYVNAVARLETDADPRALMVELHAVEEQFGRRRAKQTERWADRTLDLDLIDAGGVVIEPAGEGDLALPHPRLHERAFVLLPLREVAPLWRRPGDGRSVEELIAALDPAALHGVRRAATITRA